MSSARCPTCFNVLAIHDRDGACPRWAGVKGLGTRQGTRVIFRIGHKWPGCEGHTLAFFAESVDAGMVLVWDLTADAQFTAPLVTMTKPWSVKTSNDQKRQGAEDLGREIGVKVAVIEGLRGY